VEEKKEADGDGLGPATSSQAGRASLLVHDGGRSNTYPHFLDSALHMPVGKPSVDALS
jgi:hypothetical protein